MNKIYKVIWSKVKNQYVVVSELAHSNGKQSRTSRNSIRSRIAALVVCGAIAAFGVFSALPTSSAFAAAAETTSGQYIAVAVDSNNNSYQSGWSTKPYHEGDTRTFQDAQGNTHNYTWVRVDNKDYWVREGYTITIENESRFTAYDQSGHVIAPEKSYIIDSQKSPGASDEGLIASSEVVISDDSAHTTLTGNKLNNIKPGIYGGASNAGGTEVPVDYHYYIDNNGKGWVNVGKQSWDDFTNPNSGKGYFQEVYVQKDGSYNTKFDGTGISISPEYLYAIDKTPSDSLAGSDVRLGAFFNSDGTLYTGNVYGHNNEVLMTGVENGTYYSYWGTEINDPNTSLSEMTVGDLKKIVGGINDTIYTAQGDDIKQVSVQKSGDNGGTIGLIRRGDWNGTTYDETDPVPGTITVTSTGGNGGSGAEHDVKIKFSNTENPDGFSVDAGSKVEAVTGDNGKVSQIKINGVDYQLSAGGVIGGSIDSNGNVNITQDGKPTTFVGKIQDWNVKSGSVDDNGTLTLNTENAYGGDTGSVTVNNVASRGYVTNQIDANNTIITQQYENYFNTNDKYLSGATFDNNSGQLKLTVAKAGENGAAQEYSFDLGKYVEGKDVYVNQISIDKDNNKLILNRKNATPLELGLEELSSIGVSSSDYQLIGSGEAGTGNYTPDESGNISLQVKDSVSGDIKTVQLKDVASATKLGEVNTQVNTNTSNITSLGDRVTNVENDTITGGNIGNDGTVTLTKKGTGTEAITLAGKVQDWNVTSANLDDNGTLTLNTENAYGGDTGSVTVNNVASTGYVTNQIDANNTTITQQYENYFNTNDKYLSGATFDNNSGQLKLTVAKAGENGAAQEYSFDLGKYVEGKDVYVNQISIDKDNNKLILNRKNATPLELGLEELSSIGVSSSDYQLIGSGEAGTGNYTPDESGNISLQVKDSVSGEVRKVQLTDVASATKLSSVDSKVGDTNYSSTNYIHNGDNLTTAASTLDSTIKATADKVDAGWTATDGSTNIAVNPTNNTLKFAGDKNINVTADKASSTINVELDPTLEVESVTASKDVVTIDGNKTYSLKDIGYNTQAIKYAGNHTAVDGILSADKIQNENRSFMVEENGNITAGKVKVYATTGEVTGLSNTTWDGTTNNVTRAATEGQLQDAVEDIETNSYKGWTVSANGKADNKAEVASKGNVDFSNTDGNIIVGQDGTNLTFDLNDNIILGDESGTRIQLNGNPQKDSMISITNKDSDTVFNIAKDGTVHSDGDIVAKADSNKKYSLSEVGENAVRYNENKSTVVLAGTNGTTITNVANGINEKDAVNVSQLNAVDKKVNAGWTAKVGDDEINVRPNGENETGKDTLSFAGDNNITVTADSENNAINVKLNPDVNLTGEGKDSDNRVWLSGSNGTITATTENNLPEKTTVINGGNVYVGSSISVGDKVEITDKDITGLSNTEWNGTTTTPDRAATEGQLKDVSDTVNAGWTATDSNGASIVVNPENGSTLNFAGDRNIEVKANEKDGSIDVSLKDDIVLGGKEDTSRVEIGGTNGTIMATKDPNSMAATTTIDGGNVYVGSSISVGDKVEITDKDITGLSNTEWNGTTTTPDRAATEGQLKDVSDTVNAGWTATDSNGNSIVVNPENESTLNFAGDRNIDVKANKDNKSIDVSLSDDMVLGGKEGTSRVEIGGTNGTIMATKDPNSMAATTTIDGGNIYAGTSVSVGANDDVVITDKDITGLSNTTWDADKVVIDRAATEGQLQMVSDKVTAGWTATDDAGNKINVNPETRPTLNFASGKNITVSANEDSGEVEVSLNDNINLNNRVYINGDPEEGNNTIVDIKSSDTSKEESIFAVEDKGNGSISIGGIDITNVDGPYLAVGDGKLKFYKDGGLATGNETGTLSVRPDGDLEISGKNSSFNVDAETGNVNAVNSSGSAIMMNDDSVALNASGNGVAISDEGILLNTNGIDEDIKLVTKGTSVSVDNDGATFTNTNTNETTNIDGGTINVGDRLMVEEDGSIYATNNNGSTVMINDNGVALNSEGNGVVVSGEGITLNTNGSAVTVDRFNGATFTNTNTGETTNINGDIITTDTVKGLSNTTWDDELATQVANSEELQGTAATQGQLQQAVSAVATEAAKQHTTVSGDDNLTVKSSVNENGGTNYQVTLDDDITLGNPKAGNTEGERSFTINTTAPEGYVPDSYKEENSSGAEFIKENGGFMLFATDTQGHGIFGVTAKGSAWAKDFKTYTTDIYGNNTQYSLNDVGDAVAQMSSYYNKENGKSYTVFSRYLNEAEKDNPFATVDENATRDIPLALRDDGAVLIGATIKGDDFTDNGIRINAETETTYDGDGNEVTNNIATITGLENTEWKPPTPVATFAANDINTTSRAATEAQLDDLYSAVAAYDVNVDGTIDYSHIALAGAPYGASRAGNGTPTGGTSITNVAYASGKDGSEAVNVDYLNDAISDAAENGSISTSDQHLVANTETGSNGVYKPNDDGNVNLIVSDEKGNSSTITIGDVASKEDLDNLKDDVGDLDYSKVEGDTIIDGDSVTDAIGKLDNKIENISGTATDADNNTVTGGKINSDGTISLTQKDKDSIKLEGQLTDSGVVQEGTSFDKETGTITITSQDKYSGETSSVKVEGIASTEVVGATNKEDLATAYKDADKDGNATTEYITDSESMVEADVALDHAIQDVANTSYANDMVLSNRIDSVEKRLGNVEERIDKVGAMAAAIANLRTMGFDPEAPTEIAIGVGQYKSETGIAIGVFHYPNQDFMLSASLSSSGDELMGGIGATWKLGRKSAAERAKDEEARHLEQAEEMKKLAQQEKVKAQAQRHAKLLAERQQASQKNA